MMSTDNYACEPRGQDNQRTSNDDYEPMVQRDEDGGETIITNEGVAGAISDEGGMGCISNESGERT